MARRRKKSFRLLYALAALIGGLIILFFILPSVMVWQQTNPNAQPPFPVSVDPINKVIKENPAAAALFFKPTPAEAAAIDAQNIFASIGRLIASTPLYQFAAAETSVPNIITINPGLRKEQVAALFAKKLGWDLGEQKQFIQLPPISTDQLDEGTISPGDYSIGSGDSILAVQQQVGGRFQSEVLSRYTPAVQKVVPLNQGLTIASIIERETSDPEEMRIISGIIWNRLFAGMKLQMDSTIQYSKATGKGTWWPQVAPKDKYIDSPYNTYQHSGLPPGPISEPSTAAVLAALNPAKTSCMFYFHDDDGMIHCSDTYEQHVATLKKYYGQGR
jgi:cell division protein YceG involved in septum cleavage